MILESLKKPRSLDLWIRSKVNPKHEPLIKLALYGFILVLISILVWFIYPEKVMGDRGVNPDQQVLLFIYYFLAGSLLLYFGQTLFMTGLPENMVLWVLFLSGIVLFSLQNMVVIYFFRKIILFFKNKTSQLLSNRAFLWGMYDLANTIYSALFVTFFFPAYVKNYLGGTEFMIGATFSLSMLLVGLMVPAFGTISDLLNRRMPFIMVFTALNCVLVVFVPSVGLTGALLLALLANFFYHAALNVYNALLPEVAGDGRIGEVSGMGVALGYLGTLISLAIAYFVMNWLGWGTREAFNAMFYTTSILFFGFSLFTFFGVKEPAGRRVRTNVKTKLVIVVNSIKASLRDIGSRNTLRSFLIAAFFFTNAMNSVIIFLFLYGQKTFGLTIRSFFPVYALFGVGAALGSYLMARHIDIKGPRATLALAGWTWIAVILALIALPSVSLVGLDPYSVFLISGTIGGAALGLVWSSNRPLLIQLVPRNKLAEYFGFLELTDKFSGVLGPIVFGYLATYHGYGWALTSLLLFFIIGLLFLRNVPGKKD